MIAENMDTADQPAVVSSSRRSKRDLEMDDDEIRQLFESPDLAVPDSEVAGDGEDDEIDPSPYDEYGRDDEDDDDGGVDESPSDEVIYQEPEVDDEAVDEARKREEYEVAKELLAEQAAEEARQAVVRYLMGAAAAAEPRRHEIIPDAVEIGGEGDRFLQDVDDDGDGEREEAFDESRSMMPQPAVEKRYPYSYEPYGGRWGAFVPGVKRVTAEAYERLYELAEALNADRNSV